MFRYRKSNNLAPYEVLRLFPNFASLSGSILDSLYSFFYHLSLFFSPPHKKMTPSSIFLYHSSKSLKFLCLNISISLFLIKFFLLPIFAFAKNIISSVIAQSRILSAVIFYNTNFIILKELNVFTSSKVNTEDFF